MSYAEFLDSKRFVAPSSGLVIADADVHSLLFPFQRDLVRWAVGKGRAAIFADTGLGKTLMQIEWARLVGEPTLILAPLAVAHQTIREADNVGVEIAYARDQSDITSKIAITNYERLDRFDPSAFGAVVLDESSILKSFSGSTKRALVESFKQTPYRLCCTATPAPNDIEELTNHADFLSVMRSNEMRSTFFIADSRGEFMRYRLKGHARASFYRFLASWSAAVKKPSDLGYDDGDFILPPLNIHDHVVTTDWAPEGQLFGLGTKGVGQAAEVRAATTEARADRLAELVDPVEPWLIWVGTNAEADAITKRLPEAVEVRGSDDADDKAARLAGFASGEFRILVTKAGIAGFGMNFQRCARVAFMGLNYSYEQFYQATRRCWRFGQTRPVEAHIVISEPEMDVLDVVRQKEAQARQLSDGLIAGMVEHTRAEIFATTTAGDHYDPTQPMRLPEWITR